MDTDQLNKIRNILFRWEQRTLSESDICDAVRELCEKALVSGNYTKQGASALFHAVQQAAWFLSRGNPVHIFTVIGCLREIVRETP